MDREDRAISERTSFEPLSLEVKYPDTAILLLKSPEKPILLAAAAALSSFAEKAKGNLDTLFDLNVVDSVLGLIEHEDLFTRRFALKLLALMTAVQNVQTHLLKTDMYITFFIEMIVDESDTFLQEFSSRILAELSSDLSGSAMMLDKYPDTSYLFQKLNSKDPDIKKNCIEIIDNLLKDFNGLNLVVSSKSFSFQAIYELFKQPYPIIQQLALDVIERFVMHNADDAVQEKFRRSNGLKYLLDFLNREEWRDLHYKVLQILSFACNNLKTTELVNSTDGAKRLFSFMENTENDKLQYEALNILVRLAETIKGKKVLHSLGLVKYLFIFFQKSPQPEVQAIICRGLTKMTQYSLSADEIAQDYYPINYVLSLLYNDEAKWSERQEAALALKELFSSNYQNCVIFLDSNGLVYLIHFIEVPVKTVPWEFQVIIVEVISAIADYPSLVQDLISYELFSALCFPFDLKNDASDELKIVSCHALSRFLMKESARKVLIRVGMLKHLQNLLDEHEILPVRIAATQLLLFLAADPLLANLCVQQGILFYMLKNQSVSRVIPMWRGCIDALFNADLPMKFAYTGRLSLRDVTEDGFYVMRRSSCPFPVLEELFRLKLCPIEPIYVANFSKSRNSERDDYIDKQAAFIAARDAMRRESMEKGIRVSEGTINAWLELKFGRLQLDSDLMTYLERFKAELEDFEMQDDCELCDGECVPGLVQVSRIASKIRLLGEFVARQLSGPGSAVGTCLEQQMEFHLRAIKSNIENSVIPLGMLRLGSYIERALLFKVMADRIALPASLVRGTYGRSWIEVAVPVIERSTSDKLPPGSIITGQTCSRASKQQTRENCCDALPSKYLRENFIVDLMNAPGDLIPIGSNRAVAYCNEQSHCEFACCG